MLQIKWYNIVVMQQGACHINCVPAHTNAISLQNGYCVLKVLGSLALKTFYRSM